MSKLSFCAAAVATSATMFHLCAATPEAAINAAPVPGADVYAYSNDAKIQASAIAKQVEALTKKFKELAKADDDASKQIQALQDLCEKEGLSGENLTASVFSVAAGKTISAIVKALKEDETPELKVDDFGLIVAVAVKKPITKANLKNVFDGILKLAPETSDKDEFLKHFAAADFTHGGVNGIAISLKLDEDDLEDMPFDKLPVFAVAFPADGKVVYLGMEKDVKAAIDRANAGTKAEPAAALKKILDANLGGKPLEKRDAFFAFVVPKVFRDAMAELEEQMDGADFMPPGVLPGIKAAKELQGFRSFGDYGDKLDGTINFVLESAETAAMLKDVIQINVLNMGKMFAFQFIGKSIPFTDNLVAAADGASTSVNFTVTADDVNTVFDLIKNQMDNAAAAPRFMIEDDD
ncbi:MAG: hypothetical protein FWF96_01840, partial [Kiritimatiellaeota bacterium]|nr:hypothetical protein [Kiritimatiellota bacterium]